MVVVVALDSGYPLPRYDMLCHHERGSLTPAVMVINCCGCCIAIVSHNPTSGTHRKADCALGRASVAHAQTPQQRFVEVAFLGPLSQYLNDRIDVLLVVAIVILAFFLSGLELREQGADAALVCYGGIHQTYRRRKGFANSPLWL